MNLLFTWRVDGDGPNIFQYIVLGNTGSKSDFEY